MDFVQFVIRAKEVVTRSNIKKLKSCNLVRRYIRLLTFTFSRHNSQVEFFMEYLFVLCATFSLLFFSLLITNPQKRHEHRFLIVINGLLVLSSLHIFLFYRSSEEFYLPIFSEVNWAIPLLYGLLLWLYTLSLIKPRFKMKAKHGLHFVPFILLVGYFFARLILGQGTGFDHHKGYPILKLIVNPLYLVAVVVLLRKHDRILKDQYSFIGKMNYYWLSSLAIGGLALWLISSISMVLHAIRPDALIIAGDYIVLSVLSIYMFAMSYVGFSKTEIFQNKRTTSDIYQTIPTTSLVIEVPNEDIVVEPTKQSETKSSDEESKSVPISDSEQQLYDRLLTYMDEHKPYLNPALSLHDLSLLSQISSAKLSSIINHIGNKNFYDFVNAYRVHEVQQALKRGDTKNFSLLGIAKASGFNSKASFYRTFKKVVGLTPAQYAKKVAG